MNGSLEARKRWGTIMFAVTGACAAVSLGVLVFILGYIAWHGLGAITWDFLTRLPAPVGESGGGIANSILGSLKVVGVAAAIGVPVGVFAAVYVSEYAGGGLAFLVRFAGDVLNGVPSIVIGVFAFAMVVRPMRHFSGLAGSVALALILIPIVLRNTEEFLRLVPQNIREAALALGVPRWKVVLRVVLPTASRGILTGILLAVARVSGETAPLIFTAFGNRFWDKGVLQPIATLPHTIFVNAISPYEEWHRQAWAAAAVLMAVVVTANVAARWMLGGLAGESHG